MSEWLCVRDVMNSKSDFMFRHPVLYNDYTHLSKYYAMESRVFLAKVENGETVKTDRWFVNEMIFDLDFDHEHVKGKTDFELKEMLEKALLEIESILGKPKYVIRNRTNYQDWEVERYFTKQGVVKLPKTYGAQVVYELSESIQSIYVERVKLYNNVRMLITNIIGADPNFKGHMFKNYHSKLFIVEKNEVEPLDLKDIAKRLNLENVDKIYALKPFETLQPHVPPIFAKYCNKLYNWYVDLNRYRLHGFSVEQQNVNIDSIKCESRNVTLFKYLSMLPTHDVETAQQLDLINKGLFDHCENSEALHEDEFERTRNSVLLFREKHGEPEITLNGELKDMRVIKWKHKYLDIGLFKRMKPMFERKLASDYVGPLKLMDEGLKDSILVNAMIKIGPDLFFENIRTLMTPDFVHWFQMLLGESRPHGLNDVFIDVQRALYALHFQWLNYCKSTKNGKLSATGKNLKVKKESNDRISSNDVRFLWLVPYASCCPNLMSEAIRFKTAYQLLIKNDHLDKNGLPKPISYYQGLFHVRNADASLYVKIIRLYVHLMKIIDLKRSSKNSSTIHSENKIKLINILIIVDDVRLSIKSLMLNMFMITLNVNNKKHDNIGYGFRYPGG